MPGRRPKAWRTGASRRRRRAALPADAPTPARARRSAHRRSRPRRRAPAAAPAAAAPPRARASRAIRTATRLPRTRSASGDLDEDDLENSMSLAAMEAELKPQVLETFDRIADAYKKLRRLQDQNVENKLKNESLSPAQERKYKKLKEEIDRRGEVAAAQPGAHRFPGRAALRHQQAPGRLRGAADAARREPRRRPRRLPEELPGLRARSALAQPRVEAVRARLEELGRRRQGPHQGNPRRHPRARGRDRAGDPGIPQASSRWCRRASARRARRRRKWSRRTCASSSPSPRNTPIAACSSST